MRRKMNISVLAQLPARDHRSIGTEVNCFQVGFRRRNGEDLISLLSRKRQSADSQWCATTAREVFDDARIVAGAHSVDWRCFHSGAAFEPNIRSRKNRIGDYCQTLRRGCAVRQTLTLNR